MKIFSTAHGKEFAINVMLTKAFGADVYFCDPAAPGQRGANENTNGLLRQFVPKRTSFYNVSQKDVDAAVSLLNNRPRKRLGWQTPDEVFVRNVLHLT